MKQPKRKTLAQKVDESGSDQPPHKLFDWGNLAPKGTNPQDVCDALVWMDDMAGIWQIQRASGVGVPKEKCVIVAMQDRKDSELQINEAQAFNCEAPTVYDAIVSLKLHYEKREAAVELASPN